MENNTNASNASGNYLSCLLQLLFYSTKIKSDRKIQDAIYQKPILIQIGRSKMLPSGREKS